MTTKEHGNEVTHTTMDLTFSTAPPHLRLDIRLNMPRLYNWLHVNMSMKRSKVWNLPCTAAMPIASAKRIKPDFDEKFSSCGRLMRPGQLQVSRNMPQWPRPAQGTPEGHGAPTPRGAGSALIRLRFGCF